MGMNVKSINSHHGCRFSINFNHCQLQNGKKCTEFRKSSNGHTVRAAEGDSFKTCGGRCSSAAFAKKLKEYRVKAVRGRRRRKTGAMVTIWNWGRSKINKLFDACGFITHDDLWVRQLSTDIFQFPTSVAADRFRELNAEDQRRVGYAMLTENPSKALEIIGAHCQWPPLRIIDEYFFAAMSKMGMNSESIADNAARLFRRVPGVKLCEQCMPMMVRMLGNESTWRVMLPMVGAENFSSLKNQKQFDAVIGMLNSLDDFTAATLLGVPPTDVAVAVLERLACGRRVALLQQLFPSSSCGKTKLVDLGMATIFKMANMRVPSDTLEDMPTENQLNKLAKILLQMDNYAIARFLARRSSNVGAAILERLKPRSIGVLNSLCSSCELVNSGIGILFAMTRVKVATEHQSPPVQVARTSAPTVGPSFGLQLYASPNPFPTEFGFRFDISLNQANDLSRILLAMDSAAVDEVLGSNLLDGAPRRCILGYMMCEEGGYEKGLPTLCRFPKDAAIMLSCSPRQESVLQHMAADVSPDEVAEVLIILLAKSKRCFHFIRQQSRDIWKLICTAMVDINPQEVSEILAGFKPSYAAPFLGLLTPDARKSIMEATSVKNSRQSSNIY
jgi:hypothetical protein